MKNVSTNLVSCSERALCCRYFSINFEEQRVHVLADGGGLGEMTVGWALGVLVDGDWETLGAWTVAPKSSTYWRTVFNELGIRGVERISLVSASEPEVVLDVQPAVASVPSFGGGYVRRHASLKSEVCQLGSKARRAVREAASLRVARLAMTRLQRPCGAGKAAALVLEWPRSLAQFQPFYDLRPNRRALVRKGDEYLERLDRTLSRAVGRHGPFADPEAATSFIAGTLARAERQTKLSELTKLPGAARRALDPTAAGIAAR